MISVVYVNYNEAEKLEKSFQTIKNFAQEIVVLDLGSSDHTKEVCKKFNVKLLKHEKVEYVELVRNYAISKANGDWILVLDPDEEISLKLRSTLEDITKQDKFVAVNIPRKNIFLNKWISHTNWWPDKHIRFFRRGAVHWNKKIHSYPNVDGNVLDLGANENLAIIHFGYHSLSDFIERQNKYSGIEAENLFSIGERFSYFKLIWKPIREFLVRYIKHAGFLDGFYGFALTFLMMIYQIEIMIKLWEREKQN
ncbi:hypothetical protein A3J13_00610 [Candidatus Daviesbacteria bacterium RIFCSPLOWO2_02_FULL_36_8]|uniref:Glycosyltransferase 2-like domain-containing protein n=1 Tax=Candidatus Daviesbacteria bacterium RIFCSPLOWO2_02_FULL_36_8 TaxID=1797793 RepID=A0A1F5MFZ8_9BACT|nr:MAG: hypothetical protein A3J13_00610 [Candidatus Daviesbacteria bacterium RIFCSPLOWO2_02_FULL_36_8]